MVSMAHALRYDSSDSALQAADAFRSKQVLLLASACMCSLSLTISLSLSLSL